jgi:hypothetical protein
MAITVSKIENQKITNICKDMEKLEPLYIVGNEKYFTQQL